MQDYDFRLHNNILEGYFYRKSDLIVIKVSYNINFITNSYVKKVENYTRLTNNKNYKLVRRLNDGSTIFLIGSLLLIDVVSATPPS